MSQRTWSRRAFLSTISGTGAVLLLSPLPTFAQDEIDPRVARIVASTIGIDTHNHIDVPQSADQVPGPSIDLAGEMKRSGLSAICMTFAVDYQKPINPGDAYSRFQSALASMDQQLVNNHMSRALKLADIRLAFKKRQPIVIQSVEGGHFLEGKLERLGEAYDRGLRHLGLLHDSDASTPLGDVYTNPPNYGGLTSFGADVIRECNKLGILIDLAHANTETTAASIRVAEHPVIISHTGLDTRLGNDPKMAQMMRPRLISVEQAKMVADDGGIIGVWTHLADSPKEYAENIRALVDVIGVDHVCIGTDTKLTPGNGFGTRTNQAWKDEKIGFYYAVVDAMLKTGFSPDEIARIGGGNYCRVFEASTKGH